MANVTIVINGTQEFSGDLNEWVKQPPDVVKDMLKPGTTPKPYMKAVMMAMTDAVQADQSVIIDATHRSNRWSVMVETL